MERLLGPLVARFRNGSAFQQLGLPLLVLFRLGQRCFRRREIGARFAQGVLCIGGIEASDGLPGGYRAANRDAALD